MVDLSKLRKTLTTVRGRSAMLASIVVAVALTVGSFVLLAAFRGQLEDNLDQTLFQQAQDRAKLISEGTEPSALTSVLRRESLVWIGTPEGVQVTLGGSLIPLENPLPDKLDDTASVAILVDELKPGEDPERELADLRVATATTTDGDLVVLVGAELEEVDKAVRQLGQLFLLAVPTLVAIVGFLAWITAGRALSPVEQIRRQTTEVTGRNLSERVTVPPTNDEIQDLAVTMNHMLVRLESHQRSLKEFTSNASHELKSPVANVRALVDTATLSDDQWPALQAKLVGETDRLRDLVENLLYLASHGEGSAPPALTAQVNLDDILFDEAEIFAATGRVKVDISGVAPAAVTGSPMELRRLVRNLADNAARHAASTVSFASHEAEGSSHLMISDDGPGVPADQRDHIFERFTRLDDSRAREAGGSGLGLAIVKQIANDHGGDIAVNDGQAGGAAFIVTIPSNR